MTPEILAATAGILLSLLFNYVPGFKTWYAAKDSQVKSLIMLGLLLVITAGALGLSCYGPGEYFECSENGVWAAVTLFVTALVANQGTYTITRYVGAGESAPE